MCLNLSIPLQSFLHRTVTLAPLSLAVLLYYLFSTTTRGLVLVVANASTYRCCICRIVRSKHCR